MSQHDGLIALAIKAHAIARKGLRLESHRDLWVYKNEVARELGDRIRSVFRQADSMPGASTITWRLGKT